MQFRSGIGYDVHRFSDDPERTLVLGGVEFPGERALDGHSDADVLCHAIADAVLGALGEPDIGHFFPPGDPAAKDISSLKILEKARERVDALGGTLNNVDSTLIAEAPKILPHLAEMKAAIAGALGLEPGQVGVKATTNEKLGFLGRKEGISAMATAAVVMGE